MEREGSEKPTQSEERDSPAASSKRLEVEGGSLKVLKAEMLLRRGVKYDIVRPQGREVGKKWRAVN